MSGTTSQPNLNSLVAALQNTPRDTELDLDALNAAQRLLGSRPRVLLPVRRRHRSRRTAEVYHHEMPGGQYTNLKPAGQERWAWKTAGTRSPRRTPR